MKLHDDFGYNKLLVLKGGMDAWRQAGYKTVKAPTPATGAKGADPKPKPRQEVSR